MPGRPPPPVSLVLLGSARRLHAVAELGDTETSEEGEKHSWPQHTELLRGADHTRGCLDQGLSRTQWTGTCVVGDLVRGPAVPRVDPAWAGGGQGGWAEARHGPKLLTLWTPMGSAVPLPSHVTLSTKEADPTLTSRPGCVLTHSAFMGNLMNTVPALDTGPCQAHAKRAGNERCLVRKGL